jgi:hypothetical protein
MKKLTIIFTMLLIVTGAAFAGAYSNSVTYKGQGLIDYELKTELCGVENGAEVDGPYLLWVLTATGANNADITGPWGTAPMVKFGNGTFKYVSSWYDPKTLPGNVSATYDGKPKNVQLVISHGCRPFRNNGAWCSPGFWWNAEDTAWALTGKAKTDLFNSTVVPDFYGTALGANPTLGMVLSDNQYKSGQLASGPYGLTPFNATGAFLTDQIPCFSFDPSLVGEDDTITCPIDHFGNYKNGFVCVQ